MQIIVKSKSPDLQKKLYDLGLNSWHTWKQYQETVINTDHDYLLVSTIYKTFCRVSRIPIDINVIDCGTDEDRFLKEIEKMDKTKGMPHLILHDWDRDDKELLEELKKLGFDTEYYVEDADPDETVLITMEVDWCAWDYKLSPGEEVDPMIFPCSEDEVNPESKYYYKFLQDYIDCGDDREKFLTLAKQWESK